CRLPAGGDAAAVASLVRELVAHGVGRRSAEELARTKPEACRQALEYLPFVRVRTTRGAWLANAIRDEDGPPPGDEKGQKAPGSPQGNTARPTRPRVSPPGAPGAAILDRLRATYGSLAKTHPEAITAFGAQLARERARAERLAERLSPRNR